MYPWRIAQDHYKRIFTRTLCAMHCNTLWVEHNLFQPKSEASLILFEWLRI